MLSTKKFYKAANMPRNKGKKSAGRGSPLLGRPGQFKAPRKVGVQLAKAVVQEVEEAPQSPEMSVESDENVQPIAAQNVAQTSNAANKNKKSKDVSGKDLENERVELQKARLIPLVRGRPYMYDKDDPGHYNNLKLKLAWNEITTELGETDGNYRFICNIMNSITFELFIIQHNTNRNTLCS